MKTKHLLLIGLLLALICFAVMTVMGRTCVYTLRTIDMPGEASDYTVTFDPEPSPVELTDPAACIGCAFCATMCPDCVITVER